MIQRVFSVLFLLVGNINESISSTVTKTSDPLNTTVINVNMIYLLRNSNESNFLLQNRRLMSMNNIIKSICLNKKVNIKIKKFIQCSFVV